MKNCCSFLANRIQLDTNSQVWLERKIWKSRSKYQVVLYQVEYFCTDGPWVNIFQRVILKARSLLMIVCKSFRKRSIYTRWVRRWLLCWMQFMLSSKKQKIFDFLFVLNQKTANLFLVVGNQPVEQLQTIT